MPPKRRSSRPKRKSRSASTIVHDETVARIKTGETLTFLLGNLTLRDPLRPFRVLAVKVEYICDTKPVPMQLRINAPYTLGETARDSIVSSGVFLAGPITKRHTLRSPRSAGWYQSGCDANTVLWTLDGICPQKDYSAVATVVMKTTVQYGKEEFPEACPKILLAKPTFADGETSKNWYDETMEELNSSVSVLSINSKSKFE